MWVRRGVIGTGVADLDCHCAGAPSTRAPRRGVFVVPPCNQQGAADLDRHCAEVSLRCRVISVAAAELGYHCAVVRSDRALPAESFTTYAIVQSSQVL